MIRADAPHFGRRLAASLLALVIVTGCAAASDRAIAPAPLPPGAASTLSTEAQPPQRMAVIPVWTSSTPTLPRAMSQPDSYVAPRAYPPVVSNAPQTTTLGYRTTVTAPRDVRVMTFNLRVRTIFDGFNIWDMRRDTVVQRIRDFNPDLLGTQEGLSTQEDFLADALADYTFYGVGRDNGKRMGEMCGVFFRTSRFELLDGGHFWLSQRPDKPGSHGWGALFPRMVTWVKLRPRDGSAPAFCWFNTHFDAFNSRARSESAKMLISWMDRIAGGMPRVVTGDFNATPDSDPYRTLIARRHDTPDAALVDAFRVANPNPVSDEGTMHNFSGRRDGQRIDWILATPHFQIISSSIDRTRGATGYPSDHFPVTATLRALPTSPTLAMPVARTE